MSEPSVRLKHLLDQARRGDLGARDRLFQSCRNYIAIIARARMESWMKAKFDASDLVQQTLLDAHRGLNQFQGKNDAEWLAWLKQILENNAKDVIRHYRTDKRQAGLEAGQGDGESFNRMDGIAGDSLSTPSQVLMAHEREIAVATAMATLTEDHQTVIQLRSLQRLPFEDVAERMNRSRPAVQMLWMRAIQKLEEAISQVAE